MLVQTLGKDYAVIQVLSSRRDVEIQLCRDVLDEAPRYYTLVRVQSPEMTRWAVPYFLELEKNQHFTDLKDCFSAQGEFYISFAHSDAVPLSTALARTPYSLRERLEVAKSLLTRLALLDLPDGIAYDVLNGDNLLFSDTLEVSFNYHLRHMDLYETISDMAVQVALVQALKVLFATELADQSCPELEQLIDRLASRKYDGYLAMYRDFSGVYDILCDRHAAGSVQPNGFWFRVWEKIKKIGPYVRPAIACIAVALSVWYLVYTLMFPPKVEGRSAVVMKQIGEVEISEQD